MDEKRATFDVKLKTKDIFAFLINQSYTSFMGLVTGLIFVGAIATLIIFFNDVDLFSKILLVLIMLVYLVLNPLLLHRAAKKQELISLQSPQPTRYELSTEKLSISKNGQKDGFNWGGVLKVVELSDDILVYVTKKTAFIWPIEAIGEQMPMVKSILREVIPKRKLRIKK